VSHHRSASRKAVYKEDLVKGGKERQKLNRKSFRTSFFIFLRASYCYCYWELELEVELRCGLWRRGVERRWRRKKRYGGVIEGVFRGGRRLYYGADPAYAAVGKVL
jgi:hypothetical protein